MRAAGNRRGDERLSIRPFAEGVIVENVDPGFGAAGKDGNATSGRSTTATGFSARTSFCINCTIKEAALESEQYDRVFSISAIGSIFRRAKSPKPSRGPPNACGADGYSY